MRYLFLVALLGAVAVSSSACAHLPGNVDLAAVASDAGLTNVTTGDGTFENYKATGYHKSTEIGIGVGIPFIAKILELYPMQSDEAHMGRIASAAKQGGADAVINATPPKSIYTGIPFFFVGVYIDQTDGTGIDVK